MEQPSSINNLFDLRIDEGAQRLLTTIAKWAKIIAILGFISPVISIITVLKGVTSNLEMAAYTLGYNIIAIVIAATIGIVLNIFLYKFATNMEAGLQGMSQEYFNKGTNNLRLFFKTMGILVIVCFSLLVLGIFIFIIAFSIGVGR